MKKEKVPFGSVVSWTSIIVNRRYSSVNINGCLSLNMRNTSLKESSHYSSDPFKLRDWAPENGSLCHESLTDLEKTFRETRLMVQAKDIQVISIVTFQIFDKV